MTTFKALFNQMGKKKRRSVYLLALLQLVAASVFALWALFSNGDAFSSQDKSIAWFVMVFTLLRLWIGIYVYFLLGKMRKNIAHKLGALFQFHQVNFT